MKNGLSARDLLIIKKTISPYFSRIEAIGLFGSRTTGKFRDNSDIDLVIYSEHLTKDDKKRLYTLFLESSLAAKVTPLIYQFIKYSPLRCHIDECVAALWSDEEIKQGLTAPKYLAEHAHAAGGRRL